MSREDYKSETIDYEEMGLDMHNGRTIDDIFSIVERVTGEGDRSGSGGGTVLPDISDLLLVCDELTFRSYAAQRDMFPEVSPERWALLYDDAANYEILYQWRNAYRQRRKEVVSTQEERQACDSWMISRGQA